MTHSIDAPFPPPPAAPYPGATPAGGSSPSTTEVAKDEAKNLGQTAQQAGGQVAATAADQAREVAQETRRQAQDLLDQGRAQAREQAVTQQQKAASSLTSLADELRGMLDGTATSTSGPAHDLLHEATGKVEDLASWLQQREPADLLQEVRSFARRKPGTFLLGAALLGVVAGRLTRGVTEVHRDSTPSSGQHRMADPGYTANYVDPTPAYSGYADPGYSEPGYSEPGYSAPGYTDPGYTGTATPAYGTPAPGYGTDPTMPGTAAPGGAPLPPPPYGTVPPPGTAVPPTTPAGWDDPDRGPRGV